MEDPSADPLKMTVVGDPGVGKTSLLNRIYGDEFGEPGEDWENKRTQLTANGITRSVILTDTGGMERFRELTSASYKSADIVFIVFAVDDKQSFEHADKWVEEVNRYVPNKAVPRVLVCNKIDLDTRDVTTEQGQAYASSHNLLYLETSAKTNHNVPEMIKLTLAPPKQGKEGGGCCLLQ